MNFIEGEVLLIDKPYGWTSFDAVNKIRWNIKNKLGVKKIKVGHAGTLDPLATGLLIICTGKKTKTIDQFMGEDKTYTGTFLFGKTTPSYDLETDFEAPWATDHITPDLLLEVAQTFLGVQAQIAPVFSAKQIDGKRAYLYAREGKEVEIKPQTIEVKSFEIHVDRFPEVDFKLVCSKGTYIRSIARDFGQKVNSGATLISLRRTQSGTCNVDDAIDVEAWIQKINDL